MFGSKVDGRCRVFPMRLFCRCTDGGIVDRLTTRVDTGEIERGLFVDHRAWRWSPQQHDFFGLICPVRVNSGSYQSKGFENTCGNTLEYFDTGAGVYFATRGNNGSFSWH